MGVAVEIQKRVVWATATGQLSLNDCATALMPVCDVAAEPNAPRILVDCVSADADLKDEERYRLGSYLAQYYAGKLIPFRIAIIGDAGSLL